MKTLLAFVAFAIFTPFVLLWALIVSPFGWADDVIDGYEGYICSLSEADTDTCNKRKKGGEDA